METASHLFDSLGLLADQSRFLSSNSLVNVYDTLDLDIILSNHPNWLRIAQLPPLFIHNNPRFIHDADLPEEFWHCNNVKSERLRFSGKLDCGQNGRQRFYRLCLFSTANPIQPIAFGAIDIQLLSSWQFDDQRNKAQQFALQLELLHNFVVQEYRQLGLSKLLGYAMGDIFWHQINHVLEQLEDTDFTLQPIIVGHEKRVGRHVIVDTLEREMRTMAQLYAKEEKDFRLQKTIVNFSVATF